MENEGSEGTARRPRPAAGAGLDTEQALRHAHRSGLSSTEQYPDRVVDRRDWPRPLLDFNNHPDTTQEDVERVFEKAIVRAYEEV